MDLENVNSQAQEQPFRFNFFLSAGKESAEIHILFGECECPFCLNGTIDPEQDSFIGGYLLLHFFPLSGEAL